jgi:hypothetical protein
MIRMNKLAVFWTVLMLSSYGLVGCRHTPDEAKVRDAISSVAKAAEAGAAGDVVEPLAEDFQGNAGELDRRQLAGMVRMLALRKEHVGVTMGPVSIERRSERIVASLTVTLTSGGNLLPDDLGVYKVVTGWRKNGSDWRCYTATWTRTI